MALDASELASIQADLAEQVCDKTCVIQRSAKSPDGLGSKTETYSTVVTTKAGMQQPSSGLLSNYAYRLESLNAWHVLLPYGTNVLEGDQLLIEGQVLNVHVLLDPHSVPGLTPVLAAELKP